MEAQVNLRCCIMDDFDGEIVATIHLVLNQVNLFVEIFPRAGEFIRNEEVLTARFANYETPRVDLRTPYHPPCKEVAAILLDDSMGAERDIILHQKGGRLQKTNERQPVYNPVHFPLQFHHGEIGWHLAVRHQCDVASRNGNRVACHEHTAERLNIRVKGYQCCVALRDYFFASFPHYRNACA
jgi:hypothetical protein